MDETSVMVAWEHLPFYITGPGETDFLFGAVAVALVAILVGFGALYFTIQAIPDRMVAGAGKAQMQVVGLLGLISLFTMNNAYWIAALLLAAVRIPDIVTPLKEIARSKAGNGPLTNTREQPEAVTETRDAPPPKRESEENLEGGSNP